MLSLNHLCIFFSEGKPSNSLVTKKRLLNFLDARPHRHTPQHQDQSSSASGTESGGRSTGRGKSRSSGGKGREGKRSMPTLTRMPTWSQESDYPSLPEVKPFSVKPLLRYETPLRDSTPCPSTSGQERQTLMYPYPGQASTDTHKQVLHSSATSVQPTSSFLTKESSPLNLPTCPPSVSHHEVQASQLNTGHSLRSEPTPTDQGNPLVIIPKEEDKPSTSSLSPHAWIQMPHLAPLKRPSEMQQSRWASVPNIDPPIAHTGKNSAIWVNSDDHLRAQQEVVPHETVAYSTTDSNQAPLNLALSQSTGNSENQPHQQAVSSEASSPKVVIPPDTGTHELQDSKSNVSTHSPDSLQPSGTSTPQPSPQYCLVISPQRLQEAITSPDSQSSSKARGTIWHPPSSNSSHHPTSQMSRVVIQGSVKPSTIMSPQPVSSSSCLASLLKAGVPLVPVSSVLTPSHPDHVKAAVTTEVSQAHRQDHEGSEPPYKKRKDDIDKKEESKVTEYKARPKSKKPGQVIKRLSIPVRIKKDQLELKSTTDDGANDRNENERKRYTQSESAATSVIASTSRLEKCLLELKDDNSESLLPSGQVTIRVNQVSVISKASSSSSQAVISVSQAGQSTTETNTTSSTEDGNKIYPDPLIGTEPKEQNCSEKVKIPWTSQKFLSGKEILAIQKIRKAKKLLKQGRGVEEAGVRSSIIQKAGKAKNSDNEQKDESSDHFMEVHSDILTNQNVAATRTTTVITSSSASASPDDEQVKGSAINKLILPSNIVQTSGLAALMARSSKSSHHRDQEMSSSSKESSEQGK